MTARGAWALAVALLCTAAQAEIRVVDDAGLEVVLQAPARRIVSLAPHTTETLFEAGAGELIVGTVNYADHPDAARAIPRVGDAALLDIERIVSLRPDLIVVWLQGNSARHVDAVRQLGIPVYHDRPGRLAGIPTSLERLGRLAGTEAAAQAAARAFTERHRGLERRYSARPAVPVFFQVWAKPLLTVNDRHVISDAIRLCGGRNVFGDLSQPVPTLDVEAVLAAAPEAVVRATSAVEGEDAFAAWRRLPGMRATAAGNLVLLPTDSLGRHSPRILDGAQMLCEALEAVRAKRTP